MINPTFREERKLYRVGYKLIAGLDEAGRGSWAGPIVAAAVILEPRQKIRGVRDSKLLPAAKRQQLFVDITKRSITWGVGLVEHDELDHLGISEANDQAFRRALKNLGCSPDYLLIDYFNMHGINIPTSSFVRGDQKIYSIAAASIIAKVVRDELMRQYHRLYPHYNFAQHKGYGTAEHVEALKKHGFSPIHRTSFKLNF